MALPTWARVASVAASVLIVLGAVSIPVAAVALDDRNRQLALEAEAAAKQAAADAESLARAAADAARLNADYAGLTAALADAVHPDVAAAFDAARVDLSFATADGEVDEIASAMDAVADALGELVASAKDRAEKLIAASPLAGDSRDALADAVARLAAADDVVEALTRVKGASDTVIAAQKAGKAAAEVAAKAEAEAETETDDWSGGDGGAGDGSDGDTPSGGGSTQDLYPPGIIGMLPAPRGECGDDANGQVVPFEMSWEAREGNTVDILYAYTDANVQATGGFTLLASGRGAVGTVSVPMRCGFENGPRPYVTVKAVAYNSLGSAAAYYWGL
ncbi:hypothetical protein [Agromyces tropicus]